MKKVSLILVGFLLGTNLYALKISNDVTDLENANQNQLIPDNTVDNTDDNWSTFDNGNGEEHSKSKANNGIGNGFQKAPGKSSKHLERFKKGIHND